MPDELVGLKAQPGVLEQGKHFVAGGQFAVDDRLEPAKAACG
jgi:hypothetical protein